MSIDAGKSSHFPFDLDLGWKGLSYIELKATEDVQLDIHMRTVYMEVKDHHPMKFGWKGFHVGDKGGNEWIRIPQSDWLKLRTKLGYGQMKIIPVHTDTYQLIEEYRNKTEVGDLDDAIKNAMLIVLQDKRKQPPK